MQDAGIKVTIYFVIFGNQCKLATERRQKADIYLEAFNSHRLESDGRAIIKAVDVKL